MCVSARIVGSRSQGRICGYLPSANYYASFDHWPTRVPYVRLRGSAAPACHFFLLRSYRVACTRPYPSAHRSRLIIMARGSDYVKVQVSLMRAEMHIAMNFVVNFTNSSVPRPLIKYLCVPTHRLRTHGGNRGIGLIRFVQR